MTTYEQKLQNKFNAPSADVSQQITNVPKTNVIDLEDEDDEFIAEYSRVIDDPNLQHVDTEPTNSSQTGEPDPYINMEIGLPRMGTDGLQSARVKRRALDMDGTPIGEPHSNPLLDHRQYEVEFVDGSTEVLTANIIAENILAQVDEEGHRQLLLHEITDHRTLDDAVPKERGHISMPNGRQRKVQTTRGWEILVEWKDGSTDWIALKDLKESYPVELAEYAVHNGIQDEPAFAWWVPYTLKKRQRIISKAKTKYWDRTHKYGVRIPKSIQEAKQIDEENGDTLWMDAVRMEMKNVRVAFDAYDKDPDTLIGYTQITGHLIFDVKLGENFRRKARYVADGHKTETPAAVTYSTVVSRDSVRILLMIAALNDLDIMCADVQNAFITAPNKEKCWMRAGPEFGHEEGQVFIVTRALYGLKSASASFRAFMAEKLDEMGFKSSIANPDVWLRPAIKSDGEEYYEYILVYVDDILAISVRAREILQEVQKYVKFKNDKIEAPTNYLGAKIEKKEINGHALWAISSVDYIKAAIANVEKTFSNTAWKVPSRANTPMTTEYIPELDGTPELDAKYLQRYQELIGILRWATEIGRVDVLLETSLLSQYQASPRQGHLEQILRIFGYLKRKPKVSIYMDPALPALIIRCFVPRQKISKSTIVMRARSYHMICLNQGEDRL